MRILLNRTSSAANFADILENASRTAGVELEDLHSTHEHQLRNARASVDVIVNAMGEAGGTAARASVDLYLEQQMESHVQPRAPLKTDPQAIAAELAISDRMDIADLRRLRREFALANHPDRFNGEERLDATRRMMIANVLIDNAVKQRRVR